MTAELIGAADAAAPSPSSTAPPPSPVPPSEFDARIAALRAGMRRLDLAAVVLAGPESIYHLLGLDHLGYFAVTLLVVPVTGEPVLVAREMEQHTLRAQVPQTRHAPYGEGRDPAGVVAPLLAELVRPGGRVGVEEQTMYLPPAVLARMRASTTWCDWTDCSELPAALRTVKSPAEQERVRMAAQVSGAAMRAALETAASGVSEKTVSARTHQAMIEAGGQPPGFVPLIRSTARLAQEHVTWSDHVLAPGEGLFVELSGCVQRYHAPMSRLVYCGRPAPGAARAAEAASAGLRAAQAALTAGTRTGEVYAAWEDAVTEVSGVRQHRHHCGYLTGIGFPPSWVGGGEVLGIRPGGDTRLRPGMVFHLMSWVTQPVAHVVSDTALVTEQGCELLTRAPQELLAVP